MTYGEFQEKRRLWDAELAEIERLVENRRRQFPKPEPELKEEKNG